MGMRLSPLPQALADNTGEVVRFEEKLSCSLLLEDVDPFVTVPIIRNALGQFGSVRNVQILKSPLNPKLEAKRVIVEMATPCEAAHAVKEMQEHPFIMMKGIPRPVIATVAVPTLFPERPRKIRNSNPRPDGSTGNQVVMEPKLSCYWVECGDPDWDMVNKQKQLAKKHITESLCLTLELRKEEEKLANEQKERAAMELNKFALVDSCMKDRTVEQLSFYYGLRVNRQ